MSEERRLEVRGWGGRKTKEEGREKTLLREKGEGETFPLRDSPLVLDQPCIVVNLVVMSRLLGTSARYKST